MTQEALERFFADYERFFMDALGGKTDDAAVARQTSHVENVTVLRRK